MEISVIICTYNPVLSYISRVVESLKKQTLDRGLWELIIINNNSDNGFQNKIDINWHPKAKMVVEEKQGLTHSRVRGIGESVGKLLVFVDDDNLLNHDYLEVALKISRDWARVGVWGGNISPEFESEPPSWTKDYWYYLALRSSDKDYWSNDMSASKAEPCGAGLCLRRTIALKYIEDLNEQPLRYKLGRTGKRLISGEDTDMVFTALDQNFGMGVFKELKVTHIMPTVRLSEKYLLKLMEGLLFSHIVLRYMREKKNCAPKRDFKWHIRNLYALATLGGRKKKFYLGKLRAEREALKFIRENSN